MRHRIIARCGMLQSGTIDAIYGVVVAKINPAGRLEKKNFRVENAEKRNFEGTLFS